VVTVNGNASGHRDNATDLSAGNTHAVSGKQTDRRGNYRYVTVGAAVTATRTGTGIAFGAVEKEAVI
jgi:hypothetical protein